MHALALHLADLDLPTWRVLRDDDWVLLSRQARAVQAPWAEAVRAMLPELRWWSQLAREANPRLWKTFVVSHGHSEPSKVVWRNAQIPVILDWVSAGLINPMLELVETALAWSRERDESPDQTRFQAFIAGYRRAGEQLQGSIDEAPASRSGEDQVWRKEERLLRDFHQVAQARSQVVSWVQSPIN